MSANLTPSYLSAEERFRSASTTEDKIVSLEAMIALLPKHKGSEKLYADLKSRLAKLRKGSESKAPSRRSQEIVIEREGVAQLLVVGAPNAGKSTLVRALSHAPVEVTDYPFATHKPVPGTMRYEDLRIQLVDMPSTSPDFVDLSLVPLARTADAALVCIDLSSPDCLDQESWVSDPLKAARIELVGRSVSSIVKGWGPKQLPAVLLATKADHHDAPSSLELLRESVGDRLPIVVVSTENAQSLTNFRRACFDLVGMVRVYSKAPGKEADLSSPYVLPLGATVVDFAERVHQELRDRFDFGRVWGLGKQDGQRIGREYVLTDRDVIEVHRK